MRLWIPFPGGGISHAAVDFLSGRGHFACGGGFPFQEGAFRMRLWISFPGGAFRMRLWISFLGGAFRMWLWISFPGGAFCMRFFPSRGGISHAVFPFQGGHFACGFSLPGGAFRMRFFPSRGSISHAAGARRGSIHSCEGHSPLLALLPSRPRRCSVLWNVLLF